MALPVVVTPASDGSIAPIGVRSATQVGARWNFNVTDLAVLRFPISASGNSVSLTRIQVDWGDGTVDVSDFRPVGREFQYTHQYDLPGTYAIAVIAFNTDGTASLANITEISVLESRKEVTSSSKRWRGLGLPGATIEQTLRSVQTIVPAEVVSLAAPASAGQSSITVDGRPELFTPQAQVTITQDGKLISMGRVVSSEFNIIRLDSELNDAYDVLVANVEVRSTNLSSAMAQRANLEIPWTFPSISDTSLVKAAVRMILGTKLFERVMLPTFGSELHRIPFEQNDRVAESLVRRATFEAIQKWEPRANIADFKITRKDNDLTVTLQLALSQDSQQVFDVNFNLNSR